MSSAVSSSSETSWNKRLAALRNVPPVLRLVWDAAPAVVASGIALRLVSALIPVAMLAISKFIIDLIKAKHSEPSPVQMWWLLALNLLLAAANQVLGRTIDYTDARLADEFTREVSLRLIQHATRLDLASFEDPGFPRRAGTRAPAGHGPHRDAQRHGAAAAAIDHADFALRRSGNLLLAVGVLLLVVCVVPAFMGESHFAFLGYSLAHEITPVRRELDYLRIIGTSKENAKEVKLFGLGDHLHDRYALLTGQIIGKNIKLTRHRLDGDRCSRSSDRSAITAATCFWFGRRCKDASRGT
jgi:ATP-binding cassette subfamily B protein